MSAVTEAAVWTGLLLAAYALLWLVVAIRRADQKIAEIYDEVFGEPAEISEFEEYRRRRRGI